MRSLTSSARSRTGARSPARASLRSAVREQGHVAAPPITASRASPAVSAFLEACRLDVAVRKPGNVSQASPGHGMDADCFLRSAAAAAVPLFATGEATGARVEAAVAASFDAAGCNTNLGIVLLAAPIAVALERRPQPAGAALAAPRPPGAVLRGVVVEVLESLTIDDARAAYRAIARANPGGLGRVERQDVHHEPFIDLRSAMSLAADRDSIARQYDNGFADLFEVGVPAFNAVNAHGMRGDEKALAAAVQRTYLTYLARWPDSHIVRKHGPAAAHAVMLQARAWLERAIEGTELDSHPDFAAWDEALKAKGLNPGTSADLTVATVLLCGLLRSGPCQGPVPPGPPGHCGSAKP